MLDLMWKDIALALLGLCWGFVLWWCRRMQLEGDKAQVEIVQLRAELHTMREILPLEYVLKADNAGQLGRIEGKIDRLIERMLP